MLIFGTLCDVSHTTLTAKGARTRDAILAAAIERFGRDGYRATSVADIARDAQVGGSVAYAYFPNKESLFLAALDEDAAQAIREGVSHLLVEGGHERWHASLIPTLVEALSRHPLARRVVTGLEPTATDRVSEIPAMGELRQAVGERLRADQALGRVRRDIDPTPIGNGIVTITIALLMGALQVGVGALGDLGDDVWAVFSAALEPPAQ